METTTVKMYSIGTGTSVGLNVSPEVNTTTQAPRPDCSLFNFINLGIITGIICFAGVIGNSLAIAALYRDSKRNVTSLLFLVLAISDNGVLILTFLVKSFPSCCISLEQKTSACWYLKNVWPYMLSYCLGINSVFLFLSVWLTVLVTIHRTIAIKIPHKARTYSNIRSIRIQCVILSAVALIFSLPRFFEIKVIVNDNKASPDYTDFYKQKSYQIWYKNVAVNILVNCIPLVILSVLTWQLVQDIRKALAARMAMTTGCSEGPRNRVGVQLTIVLVLVVVVFLLCQIPHTIYAIMRVSLSPVEQKCGTAFFYFLNISDTLIVFNSSINFVLYCLAGKKFRDQLVRLFRSPCRKGRRGRRPTAYHTDYTFNSRSQFTALTTEPNGLD